MIDRNMDQTIEHLSQRIQRLIHQNQHRPTERILIALAGTPGSGKTTVASTLAEHYNSQHRLEQIQVVPMDGFHYYQSHLSTIKTKECPFKRRGAPFTFDAESFIALVRELRSKPVTKDIDDDDTIWAPSFHHALKDPVERDIRISSEQRLILLEGNYLLLDEEPWSQIRGLVDETWFVHGPRETAKERLISRHIQAGIETDREAAAERAETNDLLNADLVNAKLLPPDVVIESRDYALEVRRSSRIVSSHAESLIGGASCGIQAPTSLRKAVEV